MKRKSLLVAIAGAITFAPLAAFATPVSFDFSGQSNPLGHSLTVNGVTATAWTMQGSSGSGAIASQLYARNNGSTDTGLGVCSNLESSTVGCSSGDYNEISNELLNGQFHADGIRLENDWGGSWTSLNVSSLDKNGFSNSADWESGILAWSNDPLFGDAISSNHYFSFTAGDLANGKVYGDVLNTPNAGSFDGSAKYVLFIPNVTSGKTNNDYLVSGGMVSAPEPGSLALLGLGLLGAGIAARKRRAK